MIHRKKIATMVATSVITGMSLTATIGQAEASALNDAFDRLSSAGGGFSSSTSATAFETRTRHGYSAGGMTMRFSQNRYSLVNLDPPRLEVGCNGIDAHFGGFSYIDSEQIQQMLEQIAQGVVALSFQLALKQLCPICGDVLEFAQRMAQAAAKLSQDSCEAAQAIVDGFPDYTDELSNLWCSSVGMFEGVESDWLAAQQDTCDTSGDAGGEIYDHLEANEGDKALAMDINGNRTWLGLQEAGIAPGKDGTNNMGAENKIFAELLMSWIGTEVRNKNKDGETNTYAPTIETGSAMLDVFLCGSERASPSQIQYAEFINDFCEDKVWQEGSSGQKMEIYTCRNSDLRNCWSPQRTKVEDMSLGQGFLTTVVTELEGAVENVASGTPLSSSQKAIIAAAPFPLYQAVNVAATYPEIAYDLVVGNSMILSYMISIEYIRHAVQATAKTTTVSQLPADVLKEFRDAQNELVALTSEKAQQINLMAETQENIMAQVDRINRSTLRNLHAMGLSGMNFARDMAREVN
ncbi:conjugal transfer protein TraH [Vreelandella aquamarina]|uniref:Conjugative transfer pilus assembly protein TraH n=1 Tax=Vreelandella aquamarina TaxID=77097 RepID=A0A1N6EJT4_9GAMM|nr:conjugal transfer protein TraH [Halomonas meridiana]MCC4288199.1 conjugal transfer protein TraH [Halomonas meridiana]SIN83295.1 conjugative transfer pilus assembly protein TraH [Halomonas meridiana]SIN85861.1 conjugative transfer pilus assembly protein TraH [Halomonas meridiana]SIN86683.1 conjugative transfer pilus assembly protein TraH [Halomonas meridiana]SIO50619.1 conjugative transfer pilus assembly protein TraH [Halomonas meridiana]